MRQIVLWTLVFVLGCSGGRVGPPTYTVRGQVTSAGKPVEGITVSFRPKDPNSGQRPANGETDSDGRYELTTFSRGDGATAGEFGVTLLKFAARQEDTSPKQSNAGKGRNESDIWNPAPPPANQLPKKYADPKTSGMSAVVTPDGENLFDFSIE